MTTLAIGLVELDTDASIVQAASKRVRYALAASSAVMVTGVGCVYLWRSHRTIGKVQSAISRALIKTSEDRALLRGVACSLGESARALHAALMEGEKRGVRQWPGFGPKLMNMLEELEASVEDAAETAALGASEEFAAVAKRRVTDALEQHHRSHATAHR